MGIVSPLGCGVDVVWHRLIAGQSGLRRLPDEMVGDLPAKVAAGNVFGAEPDQQFFVSEVLQARDIPWIARRDRVVLQ